MMLGAEGQAPKYKNLNRGCQKEVVRKARIKGTGYHIIATL